MPNPPESDRPLDLLSARSPSLPQIGAPSVVDELQSSTPRDPKRPRLGLSSHVSTSPARPNTSEWLASYDQRKEATQDKGKAVQLGTSVISPISPTRLPLPCPVLQFRFRLCPLPSTLSPSPQTASRLLLPCPWRIPCPDRTASSCCPLSWSCWRNREGYDRTETILSSAAAAFSSEKARLLGIVNAAEISLNEANRAMLAAQSKGSHLRTLADTAQKDLRTMSRRCADQSLVIRRLEKEVDSSKSSAEIAAAVFQASLSELENKVEEADRACDRTA